LHQQELLGKGSVALVVGRIEAGVTGEAVGQSSPWFPPKAAFAGSQFPVEVIVVAVRWHLRFNLLYRDGEACSA
jgi:hypothetical protein